MADAYATETEVEYFVGKAVVDAIQAISGFDLTAHIEAATASVQGALRNSGYATPSVSGGTMADILVKNAVIGLTWESIATVPEAGVRLPENWAEHHLHLAWVDIYTGKASLSLSLTKASAVGGWSATSHSTTSSTGHPMRSRRSELEGY